MGGLFYSPVVPSGMAVVVDGGGDRNVVAGEGGSSTEPEDAAADTNAGSALRASSSSVVPLLNLGPKFRVLKKTDQIWELQTVIRNVETNRSTFKFVADRLIRTVIEEGLNQLPYTECEVTTPTGKIFQGLKYQKGNCGVSIVRSGEAMEKALQVRANLFLGAAVDQKSISMG